MALALVGPACSGDDAPSADAGSSERDAGGAVDGTTRSDATASDSSASAFEKFLLSSAAGPCPGDSDCAGFVELHASGLLRVDKFGETPTTVHEATVMADDLAAAIVVLTDPELIALLDGASPACLPPTDVFESMELTLGGVVHENDTTTCDQAPIAAARAQMDALRTTYVP